jgi:hypothetical protein
MSDVTFNIVRGVLVKRVDFLRALYAAHKLHEYYTFGEDEDEAVEIKPNLSAAKFEKMLKEDQEEGGNYFMTIEEQGDPSPNHHIFEYQRKYSNGVAEFLVIGNGQYIRSTETTGEKNTYRGNSNDIDNSIVMYKPRTSYSEGAAALIRMMPRNQILRAGHIVVLAYDDGER